MFIINIFYLFTVDILYIYKSRKNIMLLLLLSHFSRVRLCATPKNIIVNPHEFLTQLQQSPHGKSS